MVASAATSSFFALALYAALGQGASLPPVRRASGMSMKGTGTGVRTMNLGGGSSSASSSSPPVSVSDFQDVIYEVDILLGGQTFSVQMDTGSADLWVYAPDVAIKLTNTTDIIATESYGQGVAEGPIVFATFSLGGFTVPNQAFINASSAQDFSFFDQGAVGIMGLAFDDANLSPINFEIQQAFGNDSTLGHTPITNIFAANPDAPNSFDVRLDRTGDLDETSSGTLIISDHDDDFLAITAQPPLYRQATGRWSVPLDGMAVNNVPFAFNDSSIDSLPKGKIAVLLDTGFTFPPLPPPAVDAIYSSIPGAVKFSDDVPQWIVPCNGTTNVTFTLGGKDFPVHPLDLTFVATTEIQDQSGNIENVTYCYNTYQYLTLDPDSFSGFDAVLGDAFLRNVYASFDYGNGTGEPFVQLLPTTPDLSEAYHDFNVSRDKALAQLPPTIDPALLIYLANAEANSTTSDTTDDSVSSGSTRVSSAAESSPSSGSDSSQKLYDLVDKYGPVIVGLLAGNILIGLLLCIIGLVACLRGHVKAGARTRSIGSSYAPVRFKEAEAYEAREYHD